MKQIRFLFLAFAAMLAFAACEKDNIKPDVPDNPDQPNIPEAIAQVLGTYDMMTVYDSIGVDGDWFENGFAGQNYDPDSGYVCIVLDPNDPNTVKIDGYEVLHEEDGTPVELHFYDTKATLNADGKLVPENSVFEMNGLHFDITYGPLYQANDELRFRIVQHVEFYGMDCGYILTARCIKRAE